MPPPRPKERSGAPLLRQRRTTPSWSRPFQRAREPDMSRHSRVPPVPLLAARHPRARPPGKPCAARPPPAVRRPLSGPPPPRAAPPPGRPTPGPPHPRADRLPPTPVCHPPGRLPTPRPAARYPQAGPPAISGPAHPPLRGGGRNIGKSVLADIAGAGQDEPVAARDVLIVLFDGVQSLDVAGPLEVLAGANRWRAAHGGPPFYRPRTASLDGDPVRTSSGLMITPDRDLRQERPGGILLVPGGEGSRNASRDLIAWLGEHAPEAAELISVCTGAFLFAAAGVTCGIDLALALVEEDLGRDAALSVARYLVVFLHRPGDQAQFSAQLASQLARRPALRAVQHWAAEHPEADLSVPALAERASLSPRQFTRAFAAEVGMTPGRYVERVRLEAARQRLEDGADGIEQTARACGYGTPETMRQAFLRALGVGPAEYRRRFHPGPSSARRPHPGQPARKESHGHRHSAV